MAQEYVVDRVSTQPPRVHEGQYGTTYYITVMLKGQARPVSIGKKAPDALKAGDTVYGTIMPATDRPTDNFKSEKKPYQATQGGSFKDQDTIRAQWAIGQAVEINVKYEPTYDVVKVENTAKDLYAMVDRVKGSSIDLNSIAPNTQVAPKQAAPTFSDGSPVPDPVDDGFDIDAPIDLSDIPF